jgi:hypothetical protein
MRSQAGGGNRRAYDEDAVPSGTTRTRSASAWPRGIVQHDVCKIREQLARTLGPGGFDPARDIAAITVNRWPHGYAYEYNSLFDSFWLEGGETPCSVARKPYGRIAIANADADAYAYTDSAMDQAYRAVGEIMKA